MLQEIDFFVCWLEE